MMMRFVLAVILCLLLATSALAQYQVVVMKKANVVRRFSTGDMIRYSMSTKKHFKRDRIVAITDTTIVTSQDTLLTHKIALIDIESDIPPSGITLETMGVYCIAAGIILPLGDLINVAVVQDQKYEMDSGVAITSASLIGVGALLVIVDKPYIKLRMTNRIMIVGYDSPLYKRSRTPAPNQFSIPGN